MSRRAATLATLSLALALPACGRERIEPPGPLRPAAPQGTQHEVFGTAGIEFDSPKGWQLRPGRAPQLATVVSATAVVALWRYPRSEPLPREGAALTQAGERLVEAIQTRDPSFRLDARRTVEVDGAPAIEVTGTVTIEGERRRVRSTHAYAKGHELVVDAYAAEADFDRVDRTVFRPLVRSLKIDPPSP